MQLLVLLYFDIFSQKLTEYEKKAVVLGSRNLFDGREATGYPSTWGSIEKVKHDRVVHDRNLITSQGPATTFEFAGEIVRTLCDENVAKNVLDAMLVSS